jgi:hypothetical protein
LAIRESGPSNPRSNTPSHDDKSSY